jgi:hypothetical protein
VLAFGDLDDLFLAYFYGLGWAGLGWGGGLGDGDLLANDVAFF